METELIGLAPPEGRATTENKKPSWRDVVPVHPVAAVFPLLSPEERQELANDIKTGGLRQKVIVTTDESGVEYVVDGSNRLDAMELAGMEVVKDGRLNPEIIEHVPNPSAELVISYNIRRRHLTALERGMLVVQALEAARKARGQQEGEIIAENPVMIGKPGSAPKKKGVRGSVKGRTGQVAHAAGIDHSTARKAIRAAAGGKQIKPPQLKSRRRSSNTSAVRPERALLTIEGSAKAIITNLRGAPLRDARTCQRWRKRVRATVRILTSLDTQLARHLEQHAKRRRSRPMPMAAGTAKRSGQRRKARAKQTTGKGK